MNIRKFLALLGAAIAGVGIYVFGAFCYAALWQWIFAQPYFPAIQYTVENGTATLVVGWMSSLSFGTARFYSLWPLYSSVYGNLTRYNYVAYFAVLPLLGGLWSRFLYRETLKYRREVNEKT